MENNLRPGVPDLQTIPPSWLMNALSASIGVFFVVLGQAALIAPPGQAAEPRPFSGMPPFADPAKMFDHLFGPEGREDQEALARIRVSLREEQQIGETAVRAYLADLKRQRIKVVSRGKDVQYLHDLVKTIQPLLENGDRYRSIKIYLAESSRCDARSFPGGTLIFFRGLLELADSEAAVVGIVGHELAHLDRGHHLRRIRQLKLAQRTFSQDAKEFSPQQFFSAGMMLAQAFMRPFRPEDEAQADRDGATWAYRAGYDPRRMAEFLLIAQKHRKDLTAWLPSFLRSHPPAHQRHDNLMRRYQELQKAEPKDELYVGVKNLKLRVARASREFAE